MKPSSLIVLISLALLCCATPVRADDDAKTLFAEGRRLREEGKCAEAIDAFRRALEAWPEGIGSLRNIAQCEEELGRYASARRSWWDLRREALKSDEPKYDDWEKDAEEAHTRLEPLVPRLTVQIRGAAPSQVRVLIDGEELEANLIGVALERDVGEHRVEVWHEDEMLAREVVLLDARQREEIMLAVTLPDKPAPDPSPVPAPPIPVRDSSGDGLLIAGLALTGVGVLGGVGAIVAGVVRGTAISDLESGCPAYPDCPPTMADTLDRGRTATDLVNVFAVIGAVGVAGGLSLVITSIATNDEGSNAGRLALSAGPGSVSVHGAF